MIKETGNELETGRSKSSDERIFMIGIKPGYLFKLNLLAKP
jgi:hypothetical protein